MALVSSFSQHSMPLRHAATQMAQSHAGGHFMPLCAGKSRQMPDSHLICHPTHLICHPTPKNRTKTEHNNIKLIYIVMIQWVGEYCLFLILTH
jgi:hypothetical protein